MRLRPTKRAGTSLIEYVTFFLVLVFVVFALSPTARNWVMDNLFR